MEVNDLRTPRMQGAAEVASVGLQRGTDDVKGDAPVGGQSAHLVARLAEDDPDCMTRRCLFARE